MVASGLPTRNGNRHAGQIAEMAISILRNLKDFSIKALPDRKISIRIGMHTGSVCAGNCSLHVVSYSKHNKNPPRLCTGTGKSTQGSKSCSPRRYSPSLGRCKFLIRMRIFLSLNKVAVAFFHQILSIP